MNEKLKNRINEKAKTVRIMSNNKKTNSKSAVQIKDDIFFPENQPRNEKRVLFPFCTTQLNHISPTIACLLIPSKSVSTHRIKSTTPRSSLSTHRKFQSTHIEIPSNKAFSDQQSDGPASSKGETAAKNINCKSNTFFTQKIHKRSPRLYIKNWNSFHQNKAKINIISNPNLKKIKLRSLKQTQNITSKSEGVLTLNMQCIPFSIWNMNKRKLLVKSVKQSPTKRKDEEMKQQNEETQNEDKMKRLQLLSRQNNLRKKILMNVLQGNPYGSQTKRPFICYFPHTDYDLALKDYVKRHEELQGRTRFLSLSRNHDDERLEKTEHIVFKRESCVNFTQFNRQRYDIKMSRADLITTILQKKATNQITIEFAREMRGRIQKLIVQAIKQQSQSSNSSKSIPLRKSKNKQSIKSIMKMINIEQKNKNIDSFSHEKKDLSRLSRINPIQSERRDSQLKIFSDLIEGLQEKSIYSHNRNSIKTENQIKQLQSDQAQNSLHQRNISQNKTNRKNNNKQHKIESKSNNELKNKMKKQKKDELMKSNQIEIKSSTKQMHNVATSVFKRQAISKKAEQVGQKQQKGKSNELKKINKQEIKKKIQKLAKQQKMIQFSNIAPRQNQQREQQQNIYLTFQTNTQNMTINSQSKHIIPTTVDITQASRTLIRVPSNNSRTAGIQSQEQNKLLFREVVKQAGQIQIVQPLLWQPFLQKMYLALRIVRWASQDLYIKLMAQKIYFISGQWFKFTILRGPQSQQQKYAIGLQFLCREKLQISIDAISLELILKMITGQRIILFKNKLKVEDEVKYHCSKGHLIYLLRKQSENIPTYPQSYMEENPPSFNELSQTIPFDKIIAEFQLISINNRINTKKLFRNILQSSACNRQERIIYMNTSISTVGTITVYFPFYKSDFYVQVLLERKSIDKLSGERVFKQIGRVRQRVKYDNIYFQFTIKGEYELKITIQNDMPCNFSICSESNHQINLNVK